MKEETIIEIGAKVMRQLKLQSGELRLLRKAVRVGTVNVISIWMKMHNKHCTVNFWYLVIPGAKWFCRASRTECKESIAQMSLKMFWLSSSLNCTWNNYNICKKLFPATSVVSRNNIVNFNWKVPVLGKCHILSCRGGDHLSGIQYWHQYK